MSSIYVEEFIKFNIVSEYLLDNSKKNKAGDKGNDKTKIPECAKSDSLVMRLIRGRLRMDAAQAN